MMALEQFRRRAVKALVLLWIFASVLAWVSMGQAAAAVSDRAVDALAGEIVRGLDRADLSAVPAASGYARPTIAIKAFSDDDMQQVINYTSWIPVPPEQLAPSADWINPDFE